MALFIIYSYLTVETADRRFACHKDHKETTGEKYRLLIDEIPVELPKVWARYVDAPLSEKELNRLRQSGNRQSPCGTLMWWMRVSKELGSESTRRPRGRPRKRIE